jgi:dTDP-4-amino-4,6-dideoxygalactose transaminase
MADYGVLGPQFDGLEIPVLEDAAEALGAHSPLGAGGAMGRAGVLSFNGNKLITTSGGGMLLTRDEQMAAKVRFWSTQSRADQPWYEHEEIGYNYRLSNLLAALGRSQLRRANQEVRARREIREWYRSRLSRLAGIEVQAEPLVGASNAWLTVVRISEDLYPNGPTRVREHLACHSIEARPVWKPMHQQPVFKDSTAFLTGAADELFREGLCLPSGSQMTETDVDQVCSGIETALAE